MKTSASVRAWPRLAGGPYSVVLGLVVVAAVFQVLNGNYLSPRNLSNLLLQIAVLGTLAIGMVVVLVLGEIDLSVGAVAGVSAAVIGVLITFNGWPAWAAILAALIVGALIGTIHGSLVTTFTIPSFIVTLAGLLVWQGAQLWLVGDGGQIPIRNDFVRSIASTYLPPAAGWGLAAVIVTGTVVLRVLHRARRVRAGLTVSPLPSEVTSLAGFAIGVGAITVVLNLYFGIPWVFVLLLSLMGAATFMMERTRFGRHIYAIGGNREAARRAGIGVRRVTIVVFAMVSTIAALAGLIEASRQFSASNALGGGTLQLNAIAAAVIGGTSLFGGRGRVRDALLGALVVGAVQNGLDLLGQPAAVKNIATGVILIIAVSADAIARQRQLARGVAD